MTSNLTPNRTNLIQLKTWLQQACNDGFSRFIQHWDIIEKAFKEEKLLVLKQDTTAIGFIVFEIENEIVTIDLAELMPHKRGQGLAKPFILDSLDYLRTQGALAVKLYCAPEESEGFWKKCGFKRFEFPNDDHIHMFKLLTETLKTTTNPDSNKTDFIKLWDCESHLARRTEPKWTWELEYKENSQTLTKPIVIPAYSGWYLELITADNQIAHKKSKFPIQSWNRPSFLVVKEIPSEYL
ncbi:MAG: hypothetical protein COA80_20035 [Leeuwenhoekiella sp.]|nr:MAG: hypothetical protein COA80_20035 [Leeuwenhoekiella sp.]